METLSHAFFLEPFFWVRIAAALLCGGIIGWERQHYQKPAGMRTGVLICLGACIFAMLDDMIRLRGFTNADPSRIVAQMVTGVGFIGAGAIIHLGATVTGMTTAATIWLMAAIGGMIGIGYPLTGMVVTGCVIIALFALHRLEHLLFRKDSEQQNPPA